MKKKVISTKTYIMFTDAMIVDLSFLELINTIFTIGLVNNLFDVNTRAPLKLYISNKLKNTGSSDEL